MADVRALHVLHACVRAKFPRELTVADVDGVDPRRAVLQGAVRKAARRCADVRHRLSRKRNGKGSESLFQLQPAAAHIGHLLA